MPRAKVPLTRSTLLETQRALSLAREGHDLLDRKREILLAELMDDVAHAEEARDKMVRSFREAYEELAGARMAMGSDRVRWASLSAPPPPQLRIVERSIVGAVVPSIECPEPQVGPSHSLAGTVAELDRAIDAFAGLIEVVCAAAQTETTALRLAREVRKAQRRVNALRNVVIPRQESIIKEVKESLEDAEREAFFRAKRLRKRQQ